MANAGREWLMMLRDGNRQYQIPNVISVLTLGHEEYIPGCIIGCCKYIAGCLENACSWLTVTKTCYQHQAASSLACGVRREHETGSPNVPDSVGEQAMYP